MDDQIRIEAKRKGMTPLEYMLDVMGDFDVDPVRRDRMAVAAAPYIHAKADTVALGKKAEADRAAQTNDQGSEWEAVLRRDRTVVNRENRLAGTN